MLVPHLQQQLIYVKLYRPIVDSLPENLRWEVICPVKRNQHTIIDLLVNSSQLVEMYLARSGASSAVIAMNVTDGRSQDIDTSGNELIDIFWRCEKRCVVC